VCIKYTMCDLICDVISAVFEAATWVKRKSVLKATIENKTTSVTTHFKKLTTGNNVFIVSVII